MEEPAENIQPSKGKVIVASKALLVKKVGDMTPKERCEYNNVGRCGVCDKDGIFTACA
jgi:hypothetical protein